MNDLTDKQQEFVRQYLVDMNATAAYKRAGYAAEGNAAEAAASRLLRNVKIAAAIQAAMNERAERTAVTADRVLQELARIGFSDMRNYTKWGPDGVVLRSSEEMDDEEAAAVAEVSQTITQGGGSLKFKLHSKVDALTKLGQHLGMFTERHVDVNLTDLSDEELQRIANGEDPVRVLADTRGRAA
jgi:phage terminase small subunit